jgi:hypothetical protein
MIAAGYQEGKSKDKKSRVYFFSAPFKKTA